MIRSRSKIKYCLEFIAQMNMTSIQQVHCPLLFDLHAHPQRLGYEAKAHNDNPIKAKV